MAFAPQGQKKKNKKYIAIQYRNKLATKIKQLKGDSKYELKKKKTPEKCLYRAFGQKNFLRV